MPSFALDGTCQSRDPSACPGPDRRAPPNEESKTPIRKPDTNPFPQYPSSRPRRQTRRRDSYPPGINMPCPEIFSKNHSRDNTPRVMGPGTNILYMADWRGLTAGDLSISLPPWIFPWTPPFAGRGGAVSGPQRGRFILPGGGLGAHFGVPVPPAVQVGQKKGDGTPSRFLSACCFWCQPYL